MLKMMEHVKHVKMLLQITIFQVEDAVLMEDTGIASPSVVKTTLKRGVKSMLMDLIVNVRVV